mgnify:CR=1 FL=1
MNAVTDAPVFELKDDWEAINAWFLDNDLTTASVHRQLAEVERVARVSGQAVAIGHPRDGTIEALQHWLPEAKAKGFVLVPVSTIVRDNMARGALSAAR